jgi:4-oxalocrotonate tautomerase
MPHVQITMLKGRTLEQKRKLATRVTDALTEECGARREAISIAIVEVLKEDFASAGTLVADKK